MNTVGMDVKMRDTIIAEFTDELREVATTYGQHECIRSKISAVVMKYVRPHIDRDYCPKCGAEQEYTANPYYIHICSECRAEYTQSDLISK
jgi:hypothetical protein